MVLHQGSCYSATPHVIPFLARLIGSDTFSAGRRAVLYRDLLRAGRPAELLADGLGGVELADLDAPQLPMEIKVTNIVWQACLRIAVAQAPRDEEAGPGRHHRGS